MLHSLFISENCSTCFGWYLHSSSGAHKLYLQQLVFVTPLLLPAAIVEELELQSSSNSSIITASSSNGVTNTRCCSYSLCAPDDGWRYHPKHVEQLPDINKLCKVASCLIYIKTNYCSEPLCKTDLAFQKCFRCNWKFLNKFSTFKPYLQLTLKFLTDDFETTWTLNSELVYIADSIIVMGERREFMAGFIVV
jgi:hypothetical protein